MLGNRSRDEKKDNRHVWHLRSIPTDLACVFMWMSVGAFFFFVFFFLRIGVSKNVFPVALKMSQTLLVHAVFSPLPLLM